MRKTAFFISFSLLAFSFASSYYFYLDLPEKIVTHWGITGQPDGYSGKDMILLMPFLTLVMFILFVLIPKIDPLKENIEKFADAYDDFILVFLLFMFYISSLMLLWNLGLKFDMNVAIIPSFSFLFFFLGEMMNSVKRNYMIGVRTPWTLANDEVWDKTHKLASKVFKIIAIILLFSLISPIHAFPLFFGLLIIGTCYILLYSYLEYKRIVKDKKPRKGN